MTSARYVSVSSSNPDWNGSWAKEDVKSDMAELGITGNWLEYVLEHMFDGCLESSFQNLICENADYGRFRTVVDGLVVIIRLS